MENNLSGLGHKQKELIKIGERKGFLDIIEVRSYYPSISELQSSMKTLEFMGYFKKIIGANGFRWIYIKGANKFEDNIDNCEEEEIDKEE